MKKNWLGLLWCFQWTSKIRKIFIERYITEKHDTKPFKSYARCIGAPMKMGLNKFCGSNKKEKRKQQRKALFWLKPAVCGMRI